MPEHTIEGHAIVPRDGGAIADMAGIMPQALKIEADWQYFQHQLDSSDLTVLGRLSHESAPNPGRRRLVITGAACELREVGPLTWEFNPAAMDLRTAFDSLLPDGGRIAVVGGRRVFDLCFALGYQAFHLTVVETCHLESGISVFTGVTSASKAIERLTSHGLDLIEKRVLDPAAEATLWHFARKARNRFNN